MFTFATGHINFIIVINSSNVQMEESMCVIASGTGFFAIFSLHCHRIGLLSTTVIELHFIRVYQPRKWFFYDDNCHKIFYSLVPSAATAAASL